MKKKRTNWYSAKASFELQLNIKVINACPKTTKKNDLGSAILSPYRSYICLYPKNPKNHKRFNQDEKLKNYKIGFMMMCLWREQELARNEFAALDA